MLYPNKSINQQILHQFVSLYLCSKPAFYSFIRPQEAFLYRQNGPFFQRPILDFGCGDGFFSHVVFAGQSVDAGLDVDEVKIRQAQAIKSYGKLLLYDGEKIPFAKNSFSTIFSNSVLEHIPNLDNSLDEIHRVLKPDGLFIATVMTDKWEQFLPLGKLLGKTYVRYLRKMQEHNNLFSYQKWQNTFEHHGFKSCSIIGYVNQHTAKYLELYHYLSLPFLISYKFTGNWVPIPHWHKPFKLSQKISSIISADIYTPVGDSSALFFMLKKLS
jgi:SAM-dependent methyltransferase